MKKTTMQHNPNGKGNGKKHEKVTLENVYNMATKAAYCTVKLIDSKSGTPMTKNLLMGFIDLEHSQDSCDLVQEAAAAMIENIDHSDVFLLGCKAVNNYIYRQKQNRGKYKHIYVDNPETGEIEDVNDTISKIVDKVGYSEVIDNICAILSTHQTKVLKLMGIGYPITVIAKKMNVNKQTIIKHIERIRQKAKMIYPNSTF